MQGLHSTSALFWAPEKAEVRQPILILSPLSGPMSKVFANTGKTLPPSYLTPAFSGVPDRGDKNRIGYLTPAFSGAQKKEGRSKERPLALVPTRCAHSADTLHMLHSGLDIN